MGNFTHAQETKIPVKVSSTIEEQFLNRYMDLNKALGENIDHIASLNLNYLIASLTALILVMGAIGFLVYFFGYKPSKEEIKIQKDELLKLKNEIDQKLDTIDGNASNRIQEMEDKLNEQIQKMDGKIHDDLKNLENINNKTTQNHQTQLRELEIQNLWSEQYMWSGRGIHWNAFQNLNQVIEKILVYKVNVYLLEIALGRIDDELDRLPSDFNFKGVQNDTDLKQRLLNNLNELEKNFDLLGKINNFNTLKISIAEKLKKFT